MCVAPLSSCALVPRCNVPSTEEIEKMCSYIATLRGLNPANLNIAESGERQGTCFWRLRFEIGDPKKGEITVFISPDHKFMTSYVHDLTADPSIELQRRHQQRTDALKSGSPDSRGATLASVTVVEFADFECPYCARLSGVMEEELKGDKTTKMVFRNFPLTKHPRARIAAEMSQCAQVQKRRRIAGSCTTSFFDSA
jgi:hypothetical protein